MAIANWLRNYGQGGHSEGHPFTVKSRRPGNHHYRVQSAGGGFRITAGPLPALTPR